MSTVKVNMDICYSDTLADFQGCYFNYQMNLYLSRGLSNEEYLKIKSDGNPRCAAKETPVRSAGTCHARLQKLL